jgi:hypothetical protein
MTVTHEQLTVMNDHDLLVRSVQLLEQHGAKIDTVCDAQADYSKRLTVIETEHKMMKENCGAASGGISKKSIVATATTAGPVGVLLYLLLKAVLSQEFGITI